MRVSLTEDPEFEAPVAIELVERYKDRKNHKEIIPVTDVPVDPFEYKRRHTFDVLNIGGSNVPVVAADYSNRSISEPGDLADIGYRYNAETDKWNVSDSAADLLFTGDQNTHFELPSGLKQIKNYEAWKKDRKGYPLLTPDGYLNTKDLLIPSISFSLN